MKPPMVVTTAGWLRHGADVERQLRWTGQESQSDGEPDQARRRFAHEAALPAPLRPGWCGIGSVTISVATTRSVRISSSNSGANKGTAGEIARNQARARFETLIRPAQGRDACASARHIHGGRIRVSASSVRAGSVTDHQRAARMMRITNRVAAGEQGFLPLIGGCWERIRKARRVTRPGCPLRSDCGIGSCR